ncbi:DUF4193 domain-containing protein [Arthrobacter sp. N1]
MPMDDETPRTTTANDGGTGGAGAVAQLLVAHTGDRRRVGEVLIDEDELAAADAFDLPGADLSSEEISVQILAAQADEFTCASCFLVRHRSQIAADRGGRLYCVDCEG